jgi:hypothetical protein
MLPSKKGKCSNDTGKIQSPGIEVNLSDFEPESTNEY